MGKLDKFDILLRRRGETFIAAIPQIYLYAKGASVLDAVEQLEKRKREIEADLTDSDLDEAEATQKTSTLDLTGGLKLFAAKAAIVVGLVSVCALAVGIIISAEIGNSLERFQHLGGREFWTRIEGQLSDLADPKHALPPNEQAELLGEIREIGNRWRPFIIEIENIFRPPPEPVPDAQHG